MNSYLLPERNEVLCFGFEPSATERQELQNRQLNWSLQTSEPNDAELARARGVWFAMDRAPASSDALERLSIRLANHGVLICVTARDDSEQKLAHTPLEYVPAEYRFQATYPQLPQHLVPERIARHEPGPPWTAGFDPAYLRGEQPLTAEETFLLARAIGNQGEVRLEAMDGGLSSARVFCVHTTRGNSFGHWAQPMFVKIDERRRIETEARNYRYAAPFIPFSLLPNIETVILGAKRGVLVGGLVDRSVPMWDAIRTNHADEAIANLFHSTLAGWRGQAIRQGAQGGSLWAALEAARIVSPGRIRPEFFEEFCRTQGGLRPADIAAVLRDHPHRYLRGPIHGDLHAGNVRVKGVDAILIDMYSNREGPIAADVAMLETWIAIALHERDEAGPYHDPLWAQVVEQLYAPEAFCSPIAPIDSGSLLRWMSDSVRVIRTIGVSHEIDPGEYKIAVIAALLRRCMFEAKNAKDKFRRVTAYRLASNLAASMQQGKMSNVA